MGLGGAPADSQRARYFRAGVTACREASDILFSRRKRPRGWPRRGETPGPCEGSIAETSKEIEATSARATYGQVKNAIAVEVGRIQIPGLPVESAAEGLSIQATLHSEQDEQLATGRDHGQVGDAIPVEVGADHTECIGHQRRVGLTFK